ncbi:MAG TPA: hypothetical protein VKP30_14835 [Polyangiaceae bacterium]|nr:hypothetical protein [Polyangiaceae bacterium]
MDQAPSLPEIAASWYGPLRPAARRASYTALLLATVGTLLLAREGTAGSRWFALLALTTVSLLVAGMLFWQRRRRRQLSNSAVFAVRHVDRELSDQLHRAIELAHVARERTPAVSLELAELHLQRVCARVPVTSIMERAQRRAARLSKPAMVLSMIALGGAFAARTTLFEGLNVLLARHGQAPFAMRLLEVDPVTVLPPSYLQQASELVEFGASVAVRRGSLIVVRGTPYRAESRLVLTDGRLEIPFVSDGQGGVMARYRLEDSVRLVVGARFGNVLVKQRDALHLGSVPDPPPTIELEGAPKHVSWADVQEVELRYRALDDHGLRQIDLVLRASGREERRTLLRMDGSAKSQSGAHVILPSDPFVTNAYGSVQVSIAARDDNPHDRGGWSQSAPYTLDRASVGSLEANRRKTYLGLRRELVNWLARLQSKSSDPAELAAAKAQTLARFREIESALENDSTTMRVMRTFLRAQRDKLARVSNDLVRLPSMVEEVTLAVDVAIEAVGQRDAEHVARLLADVATEIELAAKSGALAEQRSAADQRILAARAILASGAAELRSLGALGADLGEIAFAGEGRIGRAHDAHDFDNVRRAASFLAERLRRPVPSFQGGGGGGVESGRSVAKQGKPRASEADTHLERVIAELRQLARDHAAELSSVERTVAETDTTAGDAELLPEAKRRAALLRQLVERLPSVGAEPGTLKASLALAKEFVVSSAESLEQLRLSSAYDALGKADGTLAESETLSARPELGISEYSSSALQTLRTRVAEHYAWLKSILQRAQAGASAKLSVPLKSAARRERDIAERAQSLGQRESKPDAVLPDEIRSELQRAARLMNQAADALDAGEGRVGIDRQRQAQELLERSQPEPNSGPQDAGSGEPSPRQAGTADRDSRGGSVVPTSDAENRERFRRRVQEGLSREVTPEYSKAVRRYAEGLLK